MKQTHHRRAAIALFLLALSVSLQAQAKDAARQTANAALRIACDGDATDASVYINGTFRGECPIDVSVVPGEIKLRVVKKVDARFERVFEREFRLTADTARRFDVVLGDKRVNSDVLRQEKEQAEQQKKKEQARRDALAKEANAGNAKSAFQLSEIYGLEASKSPNRKFGLTDAAIEYERQALFWMERAAQLGNADALIAYGDYLYYGKKGLAEDRVRAFELFQLAITKGEERGYGYAGWYYYFGLPPRAQNFNEAGKLFEQGAAAGDGRSMLGLYFLYLKGGGTYVKNDDTALQWLKKAAAMERKSVSSRAKVELGNYYLTSVDPALRYEASRLYKDAGSIARREDDYVTQAQLAISYLTGIRTRSADEDQEIAQLTLHSLALNSDKNNTSAMNLVSELYYSGNKNAGFPVDMGLALFWAKLSASLGNEFANENTNTILKKYPGTVPASPGTAYAALAREALKNKRYEQYATFMYRAIEAYEKQSADEANRNRNLANACAELGYFLADRDVRPQEGRRLLQQALSLTPDNTHFYKARFESYLGWAEFRLGNMPEALRLLKSSAQNAWGIDDRMAHLIEVLWVTGQQQEAMTAIKNGLQYADNPVLIKETIQRLGIPM